MASKGRSSITDLNGRREATLERLGSIPINAGPLLDVLRCSPSDPDAVARAIERCPNLSARLLSVTNSAALGLRRPIDTVRRSVIHLGASRARAIALAFGLRLLHEGAGLDDPWMSQLWVSSLRKATAAQLACELIDPGRADSAYCLALIQDVGVPLLVALDPLYYQCEIIPAGQGEWCRLEREKFGIDHVELGMRLLRSWDASVELRQSIYRHHMPPQLPDAIDIDESIDPAANQRAILSAMLYLASLVPHLDEELSAEQREWLVALHASLLAPTYPSPEAFYKAAADRAAPLHADRPDPGPMREDLTASLIEAVTADSMRMVTQLSRLETALGRQREDLDNLRFQAFTDPLTKLLNRRGFSHLAERRLEIATTHGLSVCLMVLDLDRFKPVNDQFGHEAGDRMLRGIAKLLRRSLDRNDLIARVGGDEFVVLLCGVDELQARDVAARLVQNCLGRRIKLVDAPDGEAVVQFSLGAVHVSRVDEGLTVDDLIHAADETMYRRKREAQGGLLFRTLPPRPEAHALPEPPCHSSAG